MREKGKQQVADGDGRRESHLVMMGESGTIELHEIDG